MIQQPLTFQALCADIEAYVGLANCPTHGEPYFWEISRDGYGVASTILRLMTSARAPPNKRSAFIALSQNPRSGGNDHKFVRLCGRALIFLIFSF
jgi:hypothetical protein